MYFSSCISFKISFHDELGPAIDFDVVVVVVVKLLFRHCCWRAHAVVPAFRVCGFFSSVSHIETPKWANVTVRSEESLNTLWLCLCVSVCLSLCLSPSLSLPQSVKLVS